MTQTLPDTERISFAQVTAIILDTHRRLKLPMPYALGQNEAGDNDLLFLRFNSVADMQRWITEAFRDDHEPIVWSDLEHRHASLHIQSWKGWTVSLNAKDAFDAKQRKIASNMAAAARFHTWIDAHAECCGGTYRAAMDHQRDLAAILDAAVDGIVAGHKHEVTCGRCLIEVGAHTFGRGCAARLEPVFVAPAAADVAIVGPRMTADADHIHLVDPAEIAPGEPDDRGWDAPIAVSYVDQLGASA